MREATQLATSAISKITQLSQLLTAYVRHMAPQLANVVFLPARCAQDYSSYYGLSEIYTDESLLRELQKEVLQTQIDDVLRLSFSLGRAIASMEHGVLPNYEVFGTLARALDDGSFAALFSTSADMREWSRALNLVLSTLETVRFSDSILLSNKDRDPFVFEKVGSVDHRRQESQVLDASQSYGWYCERLLFATRTELHYCFLPRSGSERLAVCLWSTRGESVAWNAVRTMVAAKIRKAWTEPNGIESLAHELEGGTSADVVWEVETGRIHDELLQSNTPEAVTALAKLQGLIAAYKNCKDLERRSSALNLLRQFRQQNISEEIEFELIGHLLDTT